MKISLVSRGNNQEKIRKHSKANYCKRTGDSSSDESFCSDCNNTNGKHPSNSSKTAKKKLSKVCILIYSLFYKFNCYCQLF